MASSEDVCAKLAALERARLGERLHDDCLQIAAGIALQAKTMEKLAQQRGETLDFEAAQIGKAANGLIRKMRDLISELRGSVLDAGLRAAIRNLALDCGGACGATVRLDVRDVGPVGREAALHLYRLAQEALMSAVRHREATRLAVSMRNVGRRIALRIGDDGLRLDDDRCKVAAEASVGYLRLRARALGAAFRARSKAGGGVSIIILASCESDDAR